MSEPIYVVRLDVQHPRRKFNAVVHCADTPVIRTWLYLNGKKWSIPSGWTAKIGYGTNFEDSVSLTVVDGTISAETDAYYFDFDFSGSDTATSGDYFCQVLVNNAAGTNPVVFGDGKLTILPSPISGEYTDSVLTSTVNWDVITSIGTTPWADNTTVEVITCSDSPKTLTTDDTGKTFLVKNTCTCDITFMLPSAATSSVGSVFKFINQSTYILGIQSTAPDYIDEVLVPGNAIYSGESGANDNDPYASIRIQQIAQYNYGAIHGRLKWTYTDSVEDYQSSSSSVDSSSSSSSVGESSSSSS